MKKLRIFSNLLIVLCVIVGIYLNYQDPDVPKNVLLYFTIQSNILLALICLVLSGFDIFHKTVPKCIYIIKYIATIAILITGIVFNFILVPQMVASYGDVAQPYNLPSILLHVITPILGFISYLFFDKSPFRKKFDLYGVIAPFVYFILIIGLSLIPDLYLFNNPDGTPSKFPYFFLNYIKNGWFTLTSNVAALGTFYWFIILIILVVIISQIIRFLQKKISQTKFFHRHQADL